MRRGGSGSGVAGAGAETSGGSQAPEHRARPVAIDAVRVGAASWTNDLVLRRSWTRTPAANAARSAMGTMSVDFMVMGLSSILPKSPTVCFTRIGNGRSQHRIGACPSRCDPGPWDALPGGSVGQLGCVTVS